MTLRGDPGMSVTAHTEITRTSATSTLSLDRYSSDHPAGESGRPTSTLVGQTVHLAWSTNWLTTSVDSSTLWQLSVDLLTRHSADRSGPRL
ncbi:uncharacterized protein COLE_07670 [Cutaneotrichosporon oleaginosum]|uniref:uncharacterized protein n=1 Tax=Cutaneotrichosporon oleaginosum TaxID=879819 RepID=UPI001323F8F3|nr:hypothetical protein COLE_07670 [Cutaneotrichosporon oleaginosum]